MVETLPLQSLRKLSKSPGVLLAGFVMVFLQSGTFKACGVLLEDVVKKYNSSYLFGAWVFTFQPAFSFITAGICGSLISKTSNRTMGVIGGFLFGLGFVLEGIFGGTLWHLFFFTGVAALGGGLLYFSAFMTFVEHFEEAFSLAYSVRDLFLYLGISFMPPLLEFFRSNYGLNWTFLLLGAVDWHTAISGVLLKQVKPSPRQGKMLSAAERSSGETGGGSIKEQNQGNSHPCLALFSFLSVSPALHHPIFMLYILVHALIMVNFVIWALFLVPYGVSLGYKPGVAVFLSTFGGIGGLVGKLTVIVVFYFNKMDQLVAVIIPSIVYAFAMAGYILSDSYIMLLVSSILSGFALGYVDSSTCAMLPWYLCEMHLRQGLAMSYLYSGIFMQLGGILAGAVLDVTSSFGVIFGIMFVLNLIVIVLILAMETMDSTVKNCTALIEGQNGKTEE